MLSSFQPGNVQTLPSLKPPVSRGFRIASPEFTEAAAFLNQKIIEASGFQKPDV